VSRGQRAEQVVRVLADALDRCGAASGTLAGASRARQISGSDAALKAVAACVRRRGRGGGDRFARRA